MSIRSPLKLPYIFILYIYSVCRSVVSLSGACSVVTIGGMRGWGGLWEGPSQFCPITWLTLKQGN